MTTLPAAIMVPTHADLHRQFAVYLPIVHGEGCLVPSERRNVPVAPLEEVRRTHHQFRKGAPRKVIDVVPGLVRAASRIDPRHARVITALFVETIKILLIPYFDRVPTQDFG